LPATLSTSEIAFFSAANGILTLCFVAGARNCAAHSIGYVPGP